MNEIITTALTVTEKTLSILSDLVTTVLGGIALYGLIFKRKKIVLFIRLIINSQYNERVKRVKETLGKLEGFSFEEKDERTEIFNLIGQLSGQIKPLATDKNGLIKVHEELKEILDGKQKLSEAKKRNLVYELHGILDNASYLDFNEILNNQQ